MMKLGILCLLLGVAAVRSQNLRTDCLPPWILFKDACYNFVNYPRLRLDDASGYCQMDGAALVSINTIEEHAFVLNWLEQFDNNRDTWLTSGVVKENPPRVNWLGDGTFSDNLNFWLSGTIENRNDGEHIIYNFTTTQIGWAIHNPSKNTSFICEIKQTEIYKIVQQKRDFDYGLEIDNPALAPQGPKFVEEPVDTMILSETRAAFMDCLASGNPKPTYRWYKAQTNNDPFVLLETGADTPNERYSTIGGRLTIENPSGDRGDNGVYQCDATNEFGTILSSPARLNFGSIGEFSNVGQSEVFGQVASGVSITCPTITSTPGKVYQWHKQVTPTSNEIIFIRPEMQTHTFISNNGKLYFSELAPSDAGYYYCTVSQSSKGIKGNYIGSSQNQFRTSIGFKLTISTGVSSNVRPTIQDDFIKVYPGKPKRGQTIQMECFAYGTEPLLYRWTRMNGDIPQRATFTGTQRVMTIPDVQLEDGGQYVCRVDSSRTSTHDESSIFLNIQAEPYFSYPLTSQHVDVGTGLTWHCEARGKPAPTYRWFKDGLPLQNDTGVTVIGNTVVFEAMSQKRDNGMYQCAAYNTYGTTYSSAQIRVLEFKPTFRKHPLDQSLSAAEGGNITIMCDPEAAPSPTYEWLRNGQNLGLVQGGPISNGFQMLLNGNLFIENINKGHQGEYTCKVTNSKGEASSTGHLQVFPAIVISNKPSIGQERVNESATMECKASAPPNIDVLYIWLFNNHIIDFDRQVEYRMGSGVNSGNLYVVGLQFEHEGVYTCRVTSGLDSDEASAYLKVMGPPGEPSGVFQGDNIGQDNDAIDPNEKYVRLYWSDGETHYSPIIAYTVEFRTNFNMSWRIHPYADKIHRSSVESAEYPNKRTVLLTKLKPNADHQFRVRAINEFGIGDPSLPTSFIHVDGSAPIVAPSGIRGGGGKVGDLVMKWDPMSEEDYNGADFIYIVYWRKKSNTPTDDTRWSNKEITPEEACGMVSDVVRGRVMVCSYTHLVGSQFYYMPYETRMRAKNVKGEGVLSDIYTIMSAEEMPRATPRGVYAVSYNATALQVFWDEIKDTREDLKGKLMGYRINYWDKDEDVEEQARFNIIRVPQGQDNIDHGVIIGLVAGHWYVVNVQVITSAGYGPKSEDYPMETGNYAPGNFPTEVHVYSIEGVGVRVNFRGISTLVGEQPLMGYMLQYWPSGENIRKARMVDTGRNNYGVITNLTESILYELRVYGFSGGGQGKRSSPSIYFTVGDGEVPSNPETTEVMAGGSIVQASVLSLLLPLILSHFTPSHITHTT